MKISNRFKPLFAKIIVLFIMSMFWNTAATAIESTYLRHNISTLKGRLLYLKNGDVWLTDVSNNLSEQLTTKKDITNYSISYDATKIIFVSNFSKLYELDVATGKEIYLTDLKTDMSNPSISPENDKVVFVSHSLSEFHTSPFNKAFKETVRHLWLIDLKSLKKVDLTEDSSKQYSAPKWSPDGTKISFTSSQWDVYTKNMTNLSESINKLAAGYFSEWLNKQTLAVGGPGTIDLYNVEKMTKVREMKYQPGFFPAKFTIDDADNLYFEDQTENANIDISVISIKTGRKGKIAENARSPIFVQ